MFVLPLSRFDKGKLAPQRDSSADVSSVSPLSERITKGSRSKRQHSNLFTVANLPF